MIKTHNLTKKYGELFAIQAIELDSGGGGPVRLHRPQRRGQDHHDENPGDAARSDLGRGLCLRPLDLSRPKEIRRLVGYMPDFFGVYDDMKVIEYLEFFAAAYRINGAERRQVCDEKLDLVDLDFKRDAYANTLSRGQTQRLGLARVLLHEPQVLLLDEPLGGLDPRARIEMRAVLRRLGQQGKTIMVSSHILPELADMCNKVGIIDKGVMDFNGSVAQALKKVRERIVLHIAVTGDHEAAARLLEQSDLVELAAANHEQLTVTLKKGIEDYTDLSSLLIAAGHKIKLFREEEVNLESAFMALTKGLGQRV